VNTRAVLGSPAKLLILALLCLSLTACEGPLDRAFGGGGGHLAPGFTPCGDFLAGWGESVICQPGQYCADETFSECELGCLSDYNCEDGKYCSGASNQGPGSCRRK